MVTPRAVRDPLAARAPLTRFRKLRLEEATVQELHLELIRRTQHNAFDGEKIVASLLAHRDLWQAVIFTRLLVFGRGHEELPVLGFITLRDLPENYWNADTLYILTKNVTKARQLQRVTRADKWAGDVLIFHNTREVDNSLGAYDRQAIVRVWWD
jgi:hypothetical protein